VKAAQEQEADPRQALYTLWRIRQKMCIKTRAGPEGGEKGVIGGGSVVSVVVAAANPASLTGDYRIPVERQQQASIIFLSPNTVPAGSCFSLPEWRDQATGSAQKQPTHINCGITHSIRSSHWPQIGYIDT
jgi:hypothetical protein